MMQRKYPLAFSPKVRFNALISPSKILLHLGGIHPFNFYFISSSCIRNHSCKIPPLSLKRYIQFNSFLLRWSNRCATAYWHKKVLMLQGVGWEGLICWVGGVTADVFLSGLCKQVLAPSRPPIVNRERPPGWINCVSPSDYRPLWYKWQNYLFFRENVTGFATKGKKRKNGWLENSMASPPLSDIDHDAFCFLMHFLMHISIFGGAIDCWRL